MSSRLPPILALATLALAACSDGTPAGSGTAPNPAAATSSSVTPGTERLEGVARRLAKALKDPEFRSRLYTRLQASVYPEGKIHLQRSFSRANREDLRAIARQNRESEDQADSAISKARALEVYLPVPAHRAAWTGDERLLVATADKDGDIPVAYDLNGGRHLLDPTRPPQTPVLAVVPVETDFDHPVTPFAQSCPPDIPGCGGTGGSGGSSQNGGGSNILTIPGLYMTKAHFNDDFEGWLKGSPEFEIHIMGQKGRTDSLTRYQCAGEHQPGSYYWDGGTDWSGEVLLFSQAEIDAYHSAHPGETFRIVAMEDDDTSCEMKVDQNRWAEFVASFGPLYRDITGATDSGSVKKYLAAGKSLRKVLAALASWIKTNDDLIGNAIEDKVVGEYHSGFNWILRADNNVTNGWVSLIIR